MEQKEVNFDIKNFTWTGDYQKAGEPTLYFEFNKSEYYGLVAIKGSKTPLPFWKRAIQMYIEKVVGDDNEAEIESYPKQISKSEALLKFLLAPDSRSETVADLVTQFEKIENGLLLIDSNLI